MGAASDAPDKSDRGQYGGGLMPKTFLRGVAMAALVFASAPAFAQDFSASTLSEKIRIISADDFQGRKPGTVGEEKTLAWLQAEYEAMGMQPGGPDGQWLQPVELLRLTPKGTASVTANLSGDVVAIAADQGLIVRAINSAAAADVAQAPVVFAGYGITAPERQWDDYGDVDVTGKVVVVMAGSPTFGSPYRRFYAQEAYKADEAFRRGAIGVITIPADYARAAPRYTRQQTLSPGSAELQFKGWLSAELAKTWGIGSAEDEALDAGSFKARELPLTLSVKAEEEKDVLVTYNLLARLPGTEFPDETIVFSAHWDHVGTNDHPSGDNIFNGAWDNASGTVGVMEMARQFIANGPSKRSVVFLHATAEEMGLLGAYGYTANPVYPLETTVADINIDMLPLSGPTRDVPIFGKGQNTLEDMLDVLAKAEGRYVSDDGQPAQGFYYRSDHFPFARAGVPALMPWHGVDFVDGGIEAGKAAWQERFSRDYHKPSDEWSEELDFTSAVENLTLLYRLGRQLADSRVWPEWKPESEFGQVRARSDAARADRR